MSINPTLSSNPLAPALVPALVPASARTRVLVVDDERINREILSRLLLRHGYEVDTAENVNSALAKIQRGDIDLVLLDLVMPQTDGFVCLRNIRLAYPSSELPVVIVTAESDRQRIVSAFQQGANDYVTKPIDPEIMLARVGNLARLRQAMVALRESEERYALAARGSNDGLWDWNIDDHEVYYSPRWKSMLGYFDHEISNSPDEWLRRVHPEDRQRFEEALHGDEEQLSNHLECELRMLHRDGAYRWMLCRGVFVRNSQSQIYRMAGSLTDITEGKVGDPLTGLPNRLLFVDRLERAIERARRMQNGCFAVLFLDLDNFKLINDSLGHQIGDQLLIALARRIESCVRTCDSVMFATRTVTVARHAGDEFTILLEGLSQPSDAEQVAERILDALKEPIELQSQTIFPTVSIGVAIGDRNTGSAEDLLCEADTAMYHAKSIGRGRQCQFNTGMRRQATERLELEKDLHRALQDREFRLHYQPIFALTSRQLIGFETLVRWQHPVKGMISPFAFIGAAAEMGLIIPLGWWITEQACKQAALWQAFYPSNPPHIVSINCDVKQLYQPDFLDRFEKILSSTGVNPQGINIEVTESRLMDKPDVICPIMSGLRKLGLRVGIDDFGTGYSSLAYLHRFPLDMLKIDRSFVSTMLESNESWEIVRTIIQLGKTLHLKIVAEGIETQRQLDALVELGCTLGQGYLYSPPVPATQASQFFRKPINPNLFSESSGISLSVSNPT